MISKQQTTVWKDRALARPFKADDGVTRCTRVFYAQSTRLLCRHCWISSGFNTSVLQQNLLREENVRIAARGSTLSIAFRAEPCVHSCPHMHGTQHACKAWSLEPAAAVWMRAGMVVGVRERKACPPQDDLPGGGIRQTHRQN